MRLPLPKPFLTDKRFAYVLYFALSVLLMLALPRPYSILPLLGVIAAPVIFTLRKRGLVRLPLRAGTLYLLLFTLGLALMVTLPRPYPSYLLIGLVVLSLLFALAQPGQGARRVHPQAIRVRGSLLNSRSYVLLFMLGVALMLTLPRDIASRVLLLMLGVSLSVVLVPKPWWQGLLAGIDRIPLPALALPARLTMGLEIGLLLALLLLATPDLRNLSPAMRLDGAEFSYLINSGAVAGDVYQASGSIPLWNPYMGRGEPLFESPFSFALNPLMTLPFLWFGNVQGPKIALLLHIALMGLGGWTLGYMLGIRGPGRVLMGVLLASSGSLVGQVGYGFYQMGLSQCYVPWVYAGLLGTIERRERGWVGVLVVASSMMVFAGTFWYVLPTGISAILLSAFLLFKRKGWRI